MYNPTSAACLFLCTLHWLAVSNGNAVRQKRPIIGPLASIFKNQAELDRYMGSERDAGYGAYLARSKNTSRSMQRSIATSGLKRTVMQACPEEVLSADLAMLRRNIAAGPVLADPENIPVALPSEDPHHYVFITGGAYTGTTSLYSLMSTSPKASNLCSSGGPCCEGTWSLMTEGLMHYATRGDPEEPKNWNDAVEVYKKFWNMSKPVLLEKSPDNVFKSLKIYEDLTSAGKMVSIVYIVRTPCLRTREPKTGYDDLTEGVINQLLKLKSAGARILLIKYEDLMLDPYKVSRHILKFLPEMESIDPAVPGLSDAPYVEEGDERALPVAKWIERAPGLVFHPKELEKNERIWLAELGYSDEWFNYVAGHSRPDQPPVG